MPATTAGTGYPQTNMFTNFSTERGNTSDTHFLISSTEEVLTEVDLPLQVTCLPGSFGKG